MNRFGRSGSPCSPARTRLPPLPGCRAPDAGDGSHVEGAPVPPAQRLSAHQCACRRLGRLASPKWKSTVRSARTHAPTPRACVQIAPDRPSVAGTPADKRFGSGASDTSKINFRVSIKPGQLQPAFCRRVSYADARHYTTRFDNAHRTVRRELLYRLHPWFGRDVFVHGATERANGVFRCTLDGSDIARSLEIPSWMFDCAACVSDVCIEAKPF